MYRIIGDIIDKNRKAVNSLCPIIPRMVVVITSPTIIITAIIASILWNMLLFGLLSFIVFKSL